MSLKAHRSGSTFPELKKGVLRLYNSRFCPFTERIRLVLAHKNIPHEVVNIDVKDKPEWYTKITPLGKVPVLQQDDKIIYESTAVAEYLDDVYPGDRLQEDDPYKKSWDRIVLEYFSQVYSAFYAFILPYVEGKPVEDIEGKRDNLYKHLQFLEDELAKRGTQFFGGSQVKMIDFYVEPHLERIYVLEKLWPQIDLSKSRFPKLASWWGAITQVPAVKKEMFTIDQHIQICQLIIDGKSAANFGLDE